MAAAITPTDLNARCPPSGGGRPRHNAAQRTIGVGCTLMKTNKTDSSLLWSSGVRGARPEAPRAPAPARAQTGLLPVELLGFACGRWAIKNTGDTAIGARALISLFSVTENLTRPGYHTNRFWPLVFTSLDMANTYASPAQCGPLAASSTKKP